MKSEMYMGMNLENNIKIENIELETMRIWENLGTTS